MGIECLSQIEWVLNLYPKLNGHGIKAYKNMEDWPKICIAWAIQFFYVHEFNLNLFER